MDAKKKELIGNFKNTGTKWDRDPILVKDHDFRSEAKAIATPFGIYDTQANQGFVFPGTSHDTPPFAADAIAQWWLQEGCKRYPAARELFIIADGGEATVHAAVPRRKLFKTHLFSQISRNWAGEPLTDIDKALNLIRTTTTKTGLVVTAQLIADNYNKGIRITDAEMGCSTSYLTTLSVAGTTHYIPNRL